MPVRRIPSLIVAVVCLAVATASAAAQSSPRSSGRDTLAVSLFANRPYGSQADFSPVSVFLNKGFDHFQARNASRDVLHFPYRNAFENGAVDGLLHPVAAIEFYPGWSTWLRTEVFPLTYTRSDARWFVNYTEHLFAGGLTYRSLAEWYALQGAPVPRVLAGVTTFASGVMNEAAEHPVATSASSSSVADMYVFDLGSVLLFNWDRIARLFAVTLQAADWSLQPTFSLPSNELRNVGQYYIIKVPLPVDRTRLFLRGGMGVQGGLSRMYDAEHSVTLALGADTEVRVVDPVTRDESIRLAFGGGVYVDRNNSLLASLTAGPTSQRVTLNVYPGVLPGLGRDLGVWTAYTREGRMIGGVMYRRLPGLGLGYSR